jgi:alkanesulfonate monooxygenase SsuD/methylene tetrahydromethanopterin reductase-like flavin-dependent oxidoreductase (luciferase family)
MQFGLFYQVPEAAGQTHAERFAEMLDLIVFGETLGFDVAWLAEIHFGGAFSLLSAPLMMVPIIAQRTQRIRIGTAVTLLPLHHPLSCAEQAATADVLSGGRLEFGIGRGSIPTQFYGFRIPVAENRARFGEALDIIRLAWTSERFSYTGQFYQVDNLAVVPKPLQQPHPPIRVAVHTAESFAHVGDLGLPIYSGTTTTPLPQLRQDMTLYRAHLQANGHPWRQDQAALMFPVHLAKTATAARDAMRPGVEKYYRNLVAILSQLPDSYGDHLLARKTASLEMHTSAWIACKKHGMSLVCVRLSAGSTRGACCQWQKSNAPCSVLRRRLCQNFNGGSLAWLE